MTTRTKKVIEVATRKKHNFSFKAHFVNFLCENIGMIYLLQILEIKWFCLCSGGKY